MEEFRIIEEFPKYRISNFGTVQSNWTKKGWITLKCSLSGPIGKKYKSVILCDGNGIQKTIRIHILVARYFIGKKPKWAQVVRHLDNNRLNNHISNLAYGTYKDNEDDKISHGTWNTRITNAKLDYKKVEEIKIRYKNGEKQKDLAKEYNVTRPTITRAINGSIWKNKHGLN